MPPSKRFKEVLDEMWDLHTRKNAGYAGCSDDAFANFRYAELFDVSAFKGCLIRLSDKYIRVANLVRNPKNEQVGESIKDTLKDLANYAVIALCLYEEMELEEKERKENVDAGYTGNTTNIEISQPISSQKTNFGYSQENTKEEVLSGWREGMVGGS